MNGHGPTTPPNLTAPEEPLDESTAAELEALPELERIRRLERQGETTLRERRKIIALQRSQIWAVVALWLLTVVVGALFVKHLDSNTKHIGKAQHSATSAIHKTQTAQAAQRAAAIASCKRGNERTVDENLSHLDDFHFFTNTANLFELALTQPHARNPSLSPAQERHDFVLLRSYIDRLRTFAKHKTWKHLVGNCEASVDDPSQYQHLPPPILFAHKLPPPGALAIGKGE